MEAKDPKVYTVSLSDGLALAEVVYRNDKATASRVYLDSLKRGGITAYGRYIDGFKTLPIDPGLWHEAQIIWQLNVLIATNVTRADDVYIDVQVKGDDLENCFVISAIPKAALKTMRPDRQFQGGRPRTHDWEGAIIELARIIYEENSTEHQRDKLSDRLKNWFVDKTGDHPADSNIRERVRRFYNEVVAPKS